MTKRNSTWLASSILCAAVGFVGTTASAAPSAKMSTRDKAISECVALAKSSQPATAQFAADPGSGAMNIYKDCMRKKGQRP